MDTHNTSPVYIRRANRIRKGAVFVDYGRVAQPASLRHIVQYHKDIATRMQTYADPLQRTLSQGGALPALFA